MVVRIAAIRFHQWQLMLVTLAGWINRQQQYIIDYLMEENGVLREQCGKKRLRFTDDQRRRLAAKAKVLGRAVLRELGTLVTPDTLLRWHRVSAKQRRIRATEVLERVGLGDRLHHKPTELSGGQMQRCAIARALSNNPALILADEPTGNLDSESGKEITNLFEELWKQGHTIMVITHDPNMPMRTERTLYMKDGLLANGNGVPH